MSKIIKDTITCFVIMPFSATSVYKDGLEYIISGDDWKWFFENWIKKSVESHKSCNIICRRSEIEPGNFVKGIVHELNTAEFVIADVTGQRPNVFYELGVRHGLRNGSIIITQDSKEIPSDLKSYNYIEYAYPQKVSDNDKYFEIFKSNMHSQINSLLGKKFLADNPVSDFIAKHTPNEKGTKKRILTKSALKELLKFSPSDYRGLAIAISYYKIDFPWIFEFGNTLIESLKSNNLNEEKIIQIDKFLESLHVTFTAPNMVETYSDDKEFQMNFSQNYAILRFYLNELKMNLI